MLIEDRALWLSNIPVLLLSNPQVFIASECPLDCNSYTY